AGAGSTARRGALHAPLRAVLPPPARARGRGARRAPDRLLPPRGEVRVRRAAAARAAEPRARTARVQRGTDRDGEPRRGPRSGLLPRDARPAGKARERDLEAADGALRVLVDRA